MKKIHIYYRLLIFLIIAVSISNIFRFDVFNLDETFQNLPTWIYLLLRIFLEGSGVYLGALISIFLLHKRKKKEISFFGSGKSKGVLMSIIPILLMTIIGVKNNYGLNQNLYGGIAVSGSLIYCVMEEYGWRGYLQEELKGLKPIFRYLLIGSIWYLWHLSFLTEASLNENLFFFIMLIFGSWGIGQVAESTKSILASACFHLIINVMMFNSLIKDGIDGTQKLVIIGVSIVTWIFIIKKWENKNSKLANNARTNKSV